MSDKDAKKPGTGSGATSPGGTEASGGGSPETTVIDSPGGDSSAPTTLAPGEDDDGLQRMIRANTVTDSDFQYEPGQVPSQFQSLADARSKNHSKYSAASTFRMEKRFGLFSCVCVIICVVIGSGIFINAQDAVGNTKRPGAAMVIWFFMGLHSTIGALCYAELGTTLPISGGDYAYLNEAFGSYMGFLFQWCSTFLFLPAVNAILCKTVVDYFLDMIFFYAEVEIAMGDEVETDTSIGNRESVAYKSLLTCLEIILLVGVTLGNCLTTKFAEKLQNALTIAKLTACALIIIAGIYAMTSGFKTSLAPGTAFADNAKMNNLTTCRYNDTYLSSGSISYPIAGNQINETKQTVQQCNEPVDKKLENCTAAEEENGLRTVFDFGAGVYDVYFSYQGWTYLNYITEELQDPYRNLPIAICIALPLITGVYCLMNLSYMAILDYCKLTSTRVIASDALAAPFSKNVRQGIYWIAPSVVIFSAFGALVGHEMATARVLFVAPRCDHAPTVFNHVHPTRLTPIPSLVLQGFMSILFIIFQNFTLLILMSAYIETSFPVIAVMGMVYLRFKKPELERPIKFWIGIPIYFIVVSTIIFLIPIITIFGDFGNKVVHKIHIPMVIGPCVVVLVGSIVYAIFYRAKAKTPSKECKERINNKLESLSERFFHTRRAD